MRPDVATGGNLDASTHGYCANDELERKEILIPRAIRTLPHFTPKLRSSGSKPSASMGMIDGLAGD
jgi:hypothetical protein